MTLHPTRRLQDGRYILLGLLRTGGEAEVWRALDTVAGEQRALKVWLAADGGAEAAARELELARRVVHPHVVRVDDAFVDGDHAFVVMELAEGSLAERVATMGPLTPDEAFAALEGPLQALEAAHAAGIVHRDVKPHNLLVFGALDGALDGALERDGGGRPRAVVKLADFGIAQVRAEGLTRTRSGAFLGSLPFMSPEQRRDPRNVGPATDVYAAAVTLAWLVTGKAPGDLYLPETLAELRGELRGRGIEKAEVERVVGVVEAGGRLEAGGRAGVGEQGRFAFRRSALRAGTGRRLRQTAIVGSACLATGTAWLMTSQFDERKAITEATSEDISICSSMNQAPLKRVFPYSDVDPPGLPEVVGVAVGDIDRDGHVDAIWSHTLGSTLRVLWGTGLAGTWEGWTDVPTGRASAPPAIAAPSADGTVDVAVSEPESGAINIINFRGREPSSARVVGQSSMPSQVQFVDWDSDGTRDIIVDLGNPQRIAWRRGKADGSFAPHLDIVYSDGPFAVYQPPTGDRPSLIFSRGADIWHTAYRREPRRLLTTALRAVRQLHRVRDHWIIQGPSTFDTSWTALQYDEIEPASSPCRSAFDTFEAVPADLDGDSQVDFLRPTSCSYCTSSYVVYKGAR